jgi:hypothetical protein
METDKTWILQPKSVWKLSWSLVRVHLKPGLKWKWNRVETFGRNPFGVCTDSVIWSPLRVQLGSSRSHKHTTRTRLSIHTSGEFPALSLSTNPRLNLCATLKTIKINLLRHIEQFAFVTHGGLSARSFFFGSSTTRDRFPFLKSRKTFRFQLKTLRQNANEAACRRAVLSFFSNFRHTKRLYNRARARERERAAQ